MTRLTWHRLVPCGTAAVLILGTSSCAGPNARSAQEFVLSLEPLAESRAPYSRSRGIALLSDSVACVVDDYNVEIYCASPQDRLWTFGRRGEGPGEFRGSLILQPGPEGALAAFDLGLERVTVFQTSSTGPTTVLSSSPMPSLIPVTPLSSTVAGAYYNLQAGMLHQVEAEATSGRFVWERFVSPELVQCRDGVTSNATTLGIGHPIPGGGLVFVTCQGQKTVWFANRDDRLPSAVIDSPTYTENYPSERDVATYIQGMKAMTGGAVEPSRADLDEFRSKPVPWSRDSGHTVDERGRFWVATTRDREAFSYIDVYEAQAYVGTVRVRHSMVAFDRRGSGLVVLVDRPLRDDDPGGVPRRGIDWYDVSGLSFTSLEATSDPVPGARHPHDPGRGYPGGS